MTREKSTVFALAASLYLVLGFAEAALEGQPPSLIPPAAAANDSDFYSGLAQQSRDTAASARRTAAGEQANADQFRENAEGWRDNAEAAREAGQEDAARDAEASARRSEENAVESDRAARRAERRAQIAEREAKAFDEKSGKAKEKEDDHPAVLVDPGTVFHRLYILGDPDNTTEGEAWDKDKNALQECLEAPGAQAAGSTSTTLTADNNGASDIKSALEAMQKNAKPGDEVTFYYSGHGGGGPVYGGDDRQGEDNEEYDEHLNGNVFDDQVAEWLKGFDKGVSVTLLLDSCFGGGFTGGSDDVQETNGVNVIGVGNTCPTSGTTITGDSVTGCGGAADYDEDGIVTAMELEYFLRAEGWDIRAPFDNSDDISTREQLAIWRDDLWNWVAGAKVKPAEGEGIEVAEDSQTVCRFGEGTPTVYDPTPITSTPTPTTSTPTPTTPTSTPETATPPTTRVPEKKPPSTPEEPVTIYVKATQSVLEGSGEETAQAVGGQQIKLFSPSTTNVALPGPGATKDQTDHDQEPIQGVTDNNGQVVLTAGAQALGMPLSAAGGSYEVNLVASGSQNSKTVKIDANNANSALLSIPVALLDSVAGAPQILGGAAFVTLLYPAGEESTVSELIEKVIGLLGVEVNVCRIKEPMAPLGRPAVEAGMSTLASAGPEPFKLVLPK